jgi:filamentous hemagglutinin family protein
MKPAIPPNIRLKTRKSSQFRLRLLPLSIAACFLAEPAWSLPTGGQVTAGSAVFNQVGNTLAIANTPGTIINWNSFSIGVLEAVRFDQQSSLSSVLNRVTGNSSSSILGALSSNGRVFLLNPNGILFGAGSRIDVHGLIASTLNLSDQDFLAGRLNFTAGNTAGSIRNAGTLQASPGGSIYLIAPDIENSGIVRAPNGEVILAAGREVSLVDGAHPDIQVVVSAPEDKAVNLGDIAGGKVSVFGALLRQRGIVSADTVETDAAGRIVFRASKQLEVDAGSRTTANGATGGTVVLQTTEGDTYVRGTVAATGSQGTGGTIAALGNRVAVMGQAVLDASGETGGGRVMVGGDYQGGTPAVQNALVTYFGPETTLRADAGKVGAGGTVIVWADDTTRAYGNISAHGGSQRGNGGFVETSGKRYLDVTQAPDVSSRAGYGGVWLLDPENITISSASSSNISAGTPFAPSTSGASVLSDAVLRAALVAGGSVTVDTTGGSDTSGSITIDASANLSNIDLTSSPSTLNLKAHNDITFNSTLSAINNPLTLSLIADQDANGTGSIFINENISTNQGGISASAQSIALAANKSITTTGGSIDFTVASSLSTGTSSLISTAGNPAGQSPAEAKGGDITISGTANSITIENANLDGAVNNGWFLGGQGGTLSINTPNATVNLGTITAKGKTVWEAASTAGGAVTVTDATTINVFGDIDVRGGNGDNGSGVFPPGQNGGAGGSINLSTVSAGASDGIFINSGKSLWTDGGNGGNGGTDGNGGAGGHAGAITLNAHAGLIQIDSSAAIYARGGRGGDGGAAMGSSNSNGGNGGNSGNGGAITFSAAGIQLGNSAVASIDAGSGLVGTGGAGDGTGTDGTAGTQGTAGNISATATAGDLIANASFGVSGSLSLIADGNIDFATASDTALNSAFGDITLTAGGAINGYSTGTGFGANLRAWYGGAISATASNGDVLLKSLITGGDVTNDFGGNEYNTGNITVQATAGGIYVGGIPLYLDYDGSSTIARGVITGLTHPSGSTSSTTTGTISLTALNDIQVDGQIATWQAVGGYTSAKAVAGSGSITVQSSAGKLQLKDVNSGVDTWQTGTQSGNAGAVLLSAGTSIDITGNVSSHVTNNDDNTDIGHGGNITMDAGTSIHVTGNIDSGSRTAVWIYYSGPNSTAGSGNISLIARNGALTVDGDIDTSSGVVDSSGTGSPDANVVGSAGNVTLTSYGHSISLGGNIYAHVLNADNANAGGNGGNITLQSGGDGNANQDFSFSGQMLAYGGGLESVYGGSIAITSARDILLQPGSLLATNLDGGISLTASRDIQLISTYVEFPARILADTGGATLAAGRDIILDASGGSSDGGVSRIEAVGDINITAGGNTTLSAYGGQSDAAIVSSAGNIAVTATGDVSLHAYGGTYNDAKIDAQTGNVTVTGRSLALTAGFDGAEGATAGIYAERYATLVATGSTSYGGIQLLADGSGNTAGVSISGSSGAVDVRSQGGITLTGSYDGYVSIVSEYATQNVSIIAYGGDITLSGLTGGGAGIYSYDYNNNNGGSVTVNAMAGNIVLSNTGSGWVDIDGGAGTTVRASGSISVTGDAASPDQTYIGWYGGTTVYGASLSLDKASIDDTGDIHIEVDGNISLDHAATIASDGDIFLTLQGTASTVSLANASTITSIRSDNSGGCGPNGCTTYLDFPNRSGISGALIIGSTAYVPGTNAVSADGSGIYYGSSFTPSSFTSSAVFDGLSIAYALCKSGWYCWDGGSTGNWSTEANWTDLGGASGSDPGSTINWSTGQFKVPSGVSSIWDSGVGGSITALDNSGTVTITYNGSVSIDNLTLTDGQLLNSLASSLTISNVLSMNSSSAISGFPSIVKSSGNMTLVGSVTYGGALSLTSSAGTIDGTATVQGDTSITLSAYGGIGSLNIITPTVTATSQYGGVTLAGHSAAQPLALAATISAVNGDVTVTNYGPLTLNGISAYGSIASAAHSPLTVAGTVSSSTGSVSLTSSGGDPLSISAGGSVAASSGNVSLTADSGGSITINGSVSAPSGSVSFAAGSAPSGTGSVTTSAGTTSGSALSTLSFSTTTLPTTGGTTTTPTLDACVANPSLTGCSTVLPTLSTCTTAPSTPGCSAVLPTIDVCVASPTTTGCSSVLPTLSTCTTAPTTAGCSAVLPTLSTCTTAPATPGCSAVLPTVDSCVTNPNAAGCSSVLPSLSACIVSPSTPGCSAVLPSLSTCTTAPSTTGCSAVLPSIDACVANPSAAGCSSVLPTLSSCIAAPATSGCSAVLPTVSTCTSAPSTPGCSTVLPSLSTCTTAPSTPGCSAVLPALSTCTTVPTTPGCSSVLPTLSTCTATPTTPGCSAVLPSSNQTTEQQLACLADPNACTGGTPGGNTQDLVGQVQSSEQQIVLNSQTGQSDSGRPDLNLLSNNTNGGGGSTNNNSPGSSSGTGGNTDSSSGDNQDSGEEQNGQNPQGNNPQSSTTPTQRRYCN